MGDVVSMGTKKVVQVGDDKPPLGSVTELSGSGLMLDEDQIADFIFAVSALDQADTRDWQRTVMADIKNRVKGWPDG